MVLPYQVMWLGSSKKILHPLWWDDGHYKLIINWFLSSTIFILLLNQLIVILNLRCGRQTNNCNASAAHQGLNQCLLSMNNGEIDFLWGVSDSSWLLLLPLVLSPFLSMILLSCDYVQPPTQVLAVSFLQFSHVYFSHSQVSAACWEEPQLMHKEQTNLRCWGLVNAPWWMY